MRAVKLLTSAILVIGIAVPAANAGTVTFTGTVSNGIGSIAAGSVLTGTYSFNDSAAARAGSDSTFAVFDAITSLDFSVAGYAATFSNPAGGPEIQVDNNPPMPFVDRYGVVSRASDGLTGASLDGIYTLGTFIFRMDDATNTVFSDALDLPLDPNLADFTSSAFFIFFTDASGGFYAVDGTLTSLSTVVPIPASVPLLLSGLGIIAAIGRKRLA